MNCLTIPIRNKTFVKVSDSELVKLEEVAQSCFQMSKKYVDDFYDDKNIPYDVHDQYALKD